MGTETSGDVRFKLGRRTYRSQKSEGLANTRIPVKVQEGESGVPHAVLIEGTWKGIASVLKHWDVSETLSGEKRLIKSYFDVIMEGGISLRILRNQVTGSWYREDTVFRPSNPEEMGL